MKRAFFLIVIISAIAILSSCGGSYSNPSNAPVTSMIPNRVFLLNQFPGGITPPQINILNGDTDTFSTFTISLEGTPTLMRPAGSGKTIVYANTGRFSIIDNSTEAVSNSVTIGTDGQDLVGTSDGKLGFVALHNSGQIGVVDLSNASLSVINGIPGVARLVLSNDNATLLAFSDDSDSVTIVKVADGTISTVGGFDRAYSGVFSSDNTKAYILSCGAECGGGTAKVSILDLATKTVTASTAVSGATVGLLNAGKLYVAGNSAGNGTVNVLDASSLAVTTSGISISNGLHTTMVLMPNSKLYIGAKACSNTTQGCLSFFNTSNNTATVEPQTFGDVTGMTPIKGRNVAYVTEGGELRIYDTNTDKLQALQLDIVGNAVQVLNIP